MAAIAPSLLGPEAAQREERAQRSFVSPTAAFGLESAGLDNQFGQMLSTLRNNPNISSGETISSIINAQDILGLFLSTLLSLIHISEPTRPY